MTAAIQSMTGFGAAQVEREGVTVRVEIRTVNHRHLQVRLRIPTNHTRLEPLLEGQIKKAIQRGAVQVHVSLVAAQSLPDVRVHDPLAEQYVAGLRELQAKLGVDERWDAVQLLGLPGVLEVQENQGGHRQ